MLQLYQISVLSHGLMMVGPSGSGKSTAWRVLMRALERMEDIEGVVHVIEPKVRGPSARREAGRVRSQCGCYCCCTMWRFTGHHQGRAVWRPGPQHAGVDRRALHSHPAQVSVSYLLQRCVVGCIRTVCVVLVTFAMNTQDY